MVTLKCLIGVSGQIQVRSVPDLIGRSGQSGQVNLTCRPGPDSHGFVWFMGFGKRIPIPHEIFRKGSISPELTHLFGQLLS